MAGLDPAPVAPKKKRWFHPLALAQRLVIYGTIGYLVVCVYFLAIQTRMIYAGTTYAMSTETAIADAKKLGLVPWDHTTPGSTAPQGYVRPDFADPAPRGTIVYFHGNATFAWMRPNDLKAFSRRGFRVFFYEYPGFGGRPGRPSEAFIVPDARALIQSLAEAGYGPIYVWGQSLGSGVAAAVCADPKVPVEGLTLVTPWDNLANVGLSLYPFLPVRQILYDKYDSVANLQKFQHPICVVRAEHDEIIFPKLSLHLYEQLPEPKKVILQEGCGHNDIPSAPDLPWWDDALNFIAPKK